MKKEWMAILAALVLAAMTVAAADDPELTEAKRLYQAADFESAIARLHQAVDRLEKHEDAARRELADAYLYLGLSYSALGDDPAAKDAFTSLLRLEPARRLDPATYAPKIVDLFEKARLASPPPDAASTFPDPPYGVAVTSAISGLSDRFQPHDDFIYPPVDDLGASSPLIRRSTLSAATRYGVSAFVPLPGRWGRLQVSYQSGRRSLDETSTDFATLHDAPGPHASLTFRVARTVEIKTLDLTWSKAIRQKGVLVLRRELGYRYSQLDQTADERLDGQNPAQTSVLSASSHDPAHAVRFALAADVLIHRRLHLEVSGGLVGAFAGRTSGKDTSEYQGYGTTEGQTHDPNPGTSRWLGAEGSVGIRWQVTRSAGGSGLYFSAGYYSEAGALPHGDGFGYSTGPSGFRSSLGVRFGRARTS